MLFERKKFFLLHRVMCIFFSSSTFVISVDIMCFLPRNSMPELCERHFVNWSSHISFKMSEQDLSGQICCLSYLDPKRSASLRWHLYDHNFLDMHISQCCHPKKKKSTTWVSFHALFSSSCVWRAMLTGTSTLAMKGYKLTKYVILFLKIDHLLVFYLQWVGFFFPF